MSMNFINNLATTVGGNYLTGVKFVNGNSSSTGAADIDVYTVPAGKTAFVYSINYCNTTVSAIQCNTEVKISGVYYTIVRTSVSGSASPNTQIGIVLLAGETLAVNIAASGINLWAQIMEFDNTAGITIAKSFTIANGDNTLYTCPSGKVGIMLDRNLSRTSSTVHWRYLNQSGGTRSIQGYVVPNGGSAGSTNQVFTASVNNNTSGAMVTGGQILSAGDFIVLTTNSGAGTQSCWINMLEVDG